MARPLRIEYSGALYHVISRGTEKKNIFKDSRDRIKFLELLEECCERFGIIIYCYVLMGNHYHLLLETPRGDLSKVMHWLNVSFVSFFNTRHKRSGPLLQGRYKAILVDKDNYLLELTRYIHLNPYRTGIVEDPASYRWSTYRAYLGKAKREKWVDYRTILSMFGSEPISASKEYMHFVNQAKSKDADNPTENLYGQLILGDKPFIDAIKYLINQDEISPEIPQHKKLTRIFDPEQIISVVEQTLFVKQEYFTKRSYRDNTARKIAIYCMKKFTPLDNREIASFFGNLHYTSVPKQCRRFEQEMQQNSELKKTYEKVKRALKNLT